MRLLLFLIITILMSSCALTKEQRKANRIAKKIEKMKQKDPEAWKDATVELVRIDTVLQEIEVAGELRIDTLEVETLVKQFVHDTVEVPRFIKEFLEVTRDTARIDTLGIHLFIAGSNVDYELLKDEQHITAEKEVETITITNTEVVRKSFYQDWKFWLIIVILTIVYILKNRPRMPWLP